MNGFWSLTHWAYIYSRTHLYSKTFMFGCSLLEKWTMDIPNSCIDWGTCLFSEYLNLGILKELNSKWDLHTSYGQRVTSYLFLLLMYYHVYLKGSKATNQKQEKIFSCHNQELNPVCLDIWGITPKICKLLSYVKIKLIISLLNL